jgi:hypothetical protein
MFDLTSLIEKLHHIEALFAGATTDGERDAADAARARILRRLRELAETSPPVEMTYTLQNPWSKQLFVALARRYGLTPYRYRRQRYTTVVLRVSPRFSDETLWPEFLKLDRELMANLDEITRKAIGSAIHDDTSDAAERDARRAAGRLASHAQLLGEPTAPTHRPGAPRLHLPPHPRPAAIALRARNRLVGIGDRAELEEHRLRHRPGLELSGLDRKRFEAVSLVVSLRPRLGVDDDEGAPALASLIAAYEEDGLHQETADPGTLLLPGHSHPREAQRWNRVAGESLDELLRGNLGDLDRAGRHRHEPDDRAGVIHRDVRRPDVQLELVLTRVPREEQIEIRMTRAELRPVVRLSKLPDQDRHRRTPSTAGGQASLLGEERPGCRGRLAGLLDATGQVLGGLDAHHQLGRHDHIRRQIPQRAQMMSQRLFDDVTLLETASLHVAVQL